MKKIFVFSALFTCFTVAALAQLTKKLNPVVTLTMPGVIGENGTRGACVVFHPLQKKYYAAMAGNIKYAMGVFDLKGQQLSEDSLKTHFDTRGLWYNPETKTIQGNGYSDSGWTNFKLNVKGIPVGNTVFIKGMNQPTEQSVGAYDSKNKVVYFLSGVKVVAYDGKHGTAGKEYALNILIDSTVKTYDINDSYETELPSRYNSSTVVYTGIIGAEFGLLDIEAKKIELYNRATGLLAKTLILPEDAACNSMFNFCYTNGQYWLYDIDNRKWTGYK